MVSSAHRPVHCAVEQGHLPGEVEHVVSGQEGTSL
jgi:hypothetical protein